MNKSVEKLGFGDYDRNLTFTLSIIFKVKTIFS